MKTKTILIGRFIGNLTGIAEVHEAHLDEGRHVADGALLIVVFVLAANIFFFLKM